jgi:transposase
LRGQRSDVFRTRESSPEPHLPWLDGQWVAGNRNGAELWRSLRASGFRGSLRVVSEWACRRRRAEKMDEAALRRTPSARTIARLMTTGRDALSTPETLTIATIEDNVPALVEARAAVAAFQIMIRKKAGEELDDWIDRAKAGLLASFASGIIKDCAAVTAPITNTWSNGQTEGQITRLKLIKRQMYGRAKLDLLESRLIGAD